MNEIPVITRLMDRLKALETEAAQLWCLPAAAEIARRLRDLQLDLGLGVTAAGPFVIALIGGTGVGKSRLFNALIGTDGASPVSDAVRCFTRCPYIAVDQDFLRATRAHPLGALTEEYRNAEGWKAALVDTPDIDGAVKDSHEATRKAVELCDLVVYVTIHEKMKAYDIATKVRQWAPGKRWLFVVNKVDKEPDPDGLKVEFDKHLRKVGFAPDDDDIFEISAAQPDRFDFRRLRSTLMSQRSESQVEAMRISNFLGLALDTVNPRETADVSKMVDTLAALEAEYDQRYRQSYLIGLQSPLARESLGAVVRMRVWRALATRVRGLMALPVWARSRMSSMSTVFHVGRLATRGMGLLGLAGTAYATVNAILREILPLREVLIALGPQHRKVIAEIAKDSLAQLSDRGLSECLSKPVAPEPSSTKTPVSDVTAKILEAGHAVVSVFGIRPIDPADEAILEYLQMDIENLALSTAVRVATRSRNVVANLLPTLMLAHIIYRIGDAWYHANYLPWSFYGMALGLMAASLVPGYLIFDAAVRSEAGLPDVEALVGRLEEPFVTAPLRSARKRLQQFLGGAVRLRQDLLETRQSLEDKLGTAGFGVRYDTSHAEYRSA